MRERFIIEYNGNQLNFELNKNDKKIENSLSENPLLSSLFLKHKL